MVVRQALGFDAILVEDPQTSEIERLEIAELRPASAEAADSSTTNLNDVSDRDWAEARRRRDLIAPLLDGTRCPRSIVVERARAGDCAATTLYRWARLYRASGLLSSLLPEKSSGGRGKSRLNPAVEQILTQTIRDHYLSRQQRTVRSTAQEVARRCREASLHAPNHYAQLIARRDTSSVAELGEGGRSYGLVVCIILISSADRIGASTSGQIRRQEAGDNCLADRVKPVLLPAQPMSGVCNARRIDALGTSSIPPAA